MKTQKYAAQAVKELILRAPTSTTALLVNTTQLYHIDTIFDQRRRCWANVIQIC